MGLRLLPTLANARYLVGTWASPSLMSDDISFGHLVTYLLICVSSLEKDVVRPTFNLLPGLVVATESPSWV